MYLLINNPQRYNTLQYRFVISLTLTLKSKVYMLGNHWLQMKSVCFNIYCSVSVIVLGIL